MSGFWFQVGQFDKSLPFIVRHVKSNGLLYGLIPSSGATNRALSAPLGYTNALISLLIRPACSVHAGTVARAGRGLQCLAGKAQSQSRSSHAPVKGADRQAVPLGNRRQSG